MTPMLPALVLVIVALATSAFAADKADKVKEGWTRERLNEVSTECSDALVQGTWESTARDNGEDPSKPVSAEFRKKNAAEIARMKKLCACAVREGAKRHSRAEAEATPADFERAVSDAMGGETCKIAP